MCQCIELHRIEINTMIEHGRGCVDAVLWGLDLHVLLHDVNYSVIITFVRWWQFRGKTCRAVESHARAHPPNKDG